MLSILFGFLTYYVLVYMIGFLVRSAAFEGTLVAIAAAAFIGGYYARSSRLVRRACNWIGGIATAITLGEIILLPLLQGTGTGWLMGFSAIAGIITYVITRRFWHRRFLRRNPQGAFIQAPPFGREWFRWLFAFAF